MVAATAETERRVFTYEFANRAYEAIQAKGDWISRDDVVKALHGFDNLADGTIQTYLSHALTYLQKRGCIQRKFDHHTLFLKALSLTVDDAESQDLGETTPAESIPDEIVPLTDRPSRNAPAPNLNGMKVIPSNFPEGLIAAMNEGVKDKIWENRAALIREAVREYLFKFGYITKSRERGIHEDQVKK